MGNKLELSIGITAIFLIIIGVFMANSCCNDFII